jgi:hypothetical protein
MSDTKKSSRSTADLKLRFTRIASNKLVPPEGLFDERVPISNNVPAQFLPIIVFKKNNSFIILDGCKRYKFMKAHKRSSIACGIIEKTMDPIKAGLLRIELNRNRQLHSREKLLFIGWLKSHCNEKNYREQMEKLRLPANERHEYEQLLNCKPHLTEAVMQGTLDPAVAPEMNHLSETDANALVTFFSSLAFSRQMQRELAEWLPEIAYLRKMPLSTLLGTGSFADILADTRLNDPQKTAKIHDEAHSLRFPLYSATKKTWTEQARRINPDPSKVFFQPSPYFEKSSLEIRIKAEDAEGIQRIVRQLASVDLYKWQELIDPAARIVPPPPNYPPDEKTNQ